MNRKYLAGLTLCFWLLALGGCVSKNSNKKLPFLGRKHLVEKEVNGSTVIDTVYHTIPHFSFVDQDSVVVTNNTFKNKLYVADFFFTTCLTICPRMKTQMLRVYDKFEGNNDLLFLSHTIDPKHDTVGVLNDYAARLGVTADRWHFVTGNMDSIYKIAKSYLVSASKDPDNPGQYIHSGHLILVDRHGRPRGVYDGTDKEAVDRLMKDIPGLLKEK